LKTLHRLDGQALYHFKNEFRSLADVVHDNLVTLYELEAHDGTWFFTMELIDGVSFLEFVRPHAHALAAATAQQTVSETATVSAPDARPANGGAPVTGTALTGAARGVPPGAPRAARRRAIVAAALDRE